MVDYAIYNIITLDRMTYLHIIVHVDYKKCAKNYFHLHNIKSEKVGWINIMLWQHFFNR